MWLARSYNYDSVVVNTIARMMAIRGRFLVQSPLWTFFYFFYNSLLEIPCRLAWDITKSRFSSYMVLLKVPTVPSVIAGSIFVAGAQYGGVRLETNTHGTPHGDQQSPSREVPAPKGMMDDVAITDTILPENMVEAPKIFFKYGAWRYYTKSENRWQAKRRRKLRKETEVVTEKEIEEDIGESCGWGAVPEWIKYDVRIHGKVVRPWKRSTQEDSKGDNMESPARGVPEPAPIMPGTFADTETAEMEALEGLRQASPVGVVVFLVQISRDVRANKGVPKRHKELDPDEDVGVEQPEVTTGGDPSV
jgi:hypothetical protein